MDSAIPAQGAFLTVLCTVPAGFDAAGLAHRVVEGSLAACAQLGPPIESVYRWKGAVEQSAERLIIFKTTDAAYPALERAILEAHPYEVPEIVALRIERGHEAYLAWLARPS